MSSSDHRAAGAKTSVPELSAVPERSAVPSDPRAVLELLDSLGDRAGREASGLFLVEGLKFVLAAMRGRRRLHALVLARAMRPEPQTRTLLASRGLAGVPVVHVTPQRFRQLSGSAAPTGLAAIVEQRWEPLPRPKRGDEPLWLGFEELRSPGNLGTILRTAEAVGVAGHVFLRERLDPHHRVTVRASMGAALTQRFVRASPQHLRAWKERTGCVVIGASPDGRRDYRETSYRGALMLMVGAERAGLSRSQRRLCDHLVRIPMSPGVDSLNVGVATGVLLYEAHRQRHASGHYHQATARGRARSSPRPSSPRPSREGRRPRR